MDRPEPQSHRRRNRHRDRRIRPRRAAEGLGTMADNWDDILAEPIASLADPRAVAPSDGGVEETTGAWLAVNSIGDISPRPQEAPMTMPSMDAMLQIRLPI